jgi:glycosyltransferase involved in cell wall biosynthesis
MRGRPTVALISKAMTVAATHGKARLLGRHCRLVLITPERWSAYSAEHAEVPRDFVWVRLPAMLSGHNHLHIYRGLRRTLDQLRPDLVHIDEEPWSAVTWQALRHARRLKARTLAFTWQNIDKRYPPPFGAIERHTHRQVNLIIAGNDEAAGLLRRRGFAGPIRVIPQFGVDLDIFVPRPSTRKQLGLPGDCFLIGYVGRLIPEKGVRTPVEALVQLPQVRLALAGTGPDESALRRFAARLGVANRVHFLGGVPSTRVPDVIAGVDALILPSRTSPRWKEQFGRVLVEAMAMGIPVIGSDSGEIPRVIGDAGLVFPEGNAPALAVAVQMLQDDSLRTQLVSRGFDRVRAHFAQECIAGLTLDAWRSALDGA